MGLTGAQSRLESVEMAVGLSESPIYRGIPLFNHFFGLLAFKWPQKGGTLSL